MKMPRWGNIKKRAFVCLLSRVVSFISLPNSGVYKRCIILGVFWLFYSDFQVKRKRIHGIAILMRTEFLF